MMTLEQVRQALQDRKLTAIAEATGLSYQTAWRVASGSHEGLTYHTVKTLSDYLTNKDAPNAQ